MPKSLLTDVKQASFTNKNGQLLSFDAKITGWNDTRQPRLARHEPLKRDGALHEFMGRKPHEVSFDIVLVGRAWRKSFMRIQSVIDNSPFGTLTHPFFDSMEVVCNGVSGSRFSIEELDTVYVPISFSENKLDAKKELTSPAASDRIERISTYSSALNDATAAYVTASLAVQLVQEYATSYALSAAAVSLTTGGNDFTLNQKLTAVINAGSDARDAIRADPAATDDASTFGAIIAIEQLIDACVQADEALKREQPIISQFVVPSHMSLLGVAQAFYGADALSRLVEIQNNNSGRFSNPNCIPAGTVLLMASATVER